MFLFIHGLALLLSALLGSSAGPAPRIHAASTAPIHAERAPIVNPADGGGSMPGAGGGANGGSGGG